MTAKTKATAPSAKGKTPRTRQTSSRNAILEAAIDLFSRSDLDSVTIRDLEEKSGVAAPTIYHFFGDKRGLYDQAVRAAFDKVNEDVGAGIDDIEDPVLAIKSLISRYLEGFSRNTMVTRVLIRNLQSEDEALLQDIIANIYLPNLELWQRKLNAIRPGAGDGLLPLFMTSAALGFGSVANIRKLAPPIPVKPGKKEVAAIADLMLSIAMSPEIGEIDLKPAAKKAKKDKIKKGR